MVFDRSASLIGFVKNLSQPAVRASASLLDPVSAIMSERLVRFSVRSISRMALTASRPDITGSWRSFHR